MHSQADIAVVALRRIVAEVVENDFGLEALRPFDKFRLDRAHVFLIGDAPPDVDVHVRSFARHIVVAAEADMEHIVIVLKDRPRAVPVVTVRIENGEPLHSCLFPDIRYGRPRA